MPHTHQVPKKGGGGGKFVWGDVNEDIKEGLAETVGGGALLPGQEDELAEEES